MSYFYVHKRAGDVKLHGIHSRQAQNGGMIMKLRNQLLKYNLQYFADDNGNAGQDPTDNSGADGDDNQDDDQDGSQDEGQQKSKKSDKKSKYLTQEDVDRIVEERLKRERKKFQKQQTKDDSKNFDDTPGDDNAKKLSELEMKVLCYDHDIAKEYVKEAIALAKAYMDEDTDMDAALDIVVEKFPQFVKGYKADKDENEDDKKDDDKQKGSWGSRQGKEPKKPKTLEDEIREKLFG